MDYPKYIALMIRYLHKDFPKPITKLLSIVEAGKSSTGESIYQKVKKELFDNEFKLESKFVGICSDGAANLSGQGEMSLQSRLKTAIHISFMSETILINIILFVKICCKNFPRYILKFVKDISSHFSRSAQQKVNFRETQIKNNAEKVLNVKHFVETRWLSKKESVERMLKLWEHLKGYFIDEEYDLADNFTYHYLLYLNLLSIFLNKVCYYIVYFEETDLFYDDVLRKTKESYTLMAQLLLKPRPPEEDIDFDVIFGIDFENPNSEDKSKLANEDTLQQEKFWPKLLKKKR